MKKKSRSHKSFGVERSQNRDAESTPRNVKEKTFGGRNSQNKKSPQDQRNFSSQKNFQRKNWHPQAHKDPQFEFDSLLIAKKGEENLKKFAENAKKKIQQLVEGKISAVDLGLALTSHGESSQELSKERETNSKLLPRFSPNKSYIKAAQKEQINKTIEISKEEITAPTRGFALAKHKREVESLKNIPNNYSEKSLLVKEKSPLNAKITPGGLMLDDWQYQALEALLAGKHVIVDAPTSAGKTRVIEALLEYRMKEGGRLIYTSPVKSLSNDKYREFSEKYGREKVGINTGDFKENLSAPIILATLETYRNSLLGIEPNMNRRVVVYDEYHFLQDESRGSAWEESLILTPKDSQLVLLSASVPNSDEFAQWITGLTGKETAVIKVTKRPVPLVHMVYTKFGWLFAEDLKLSNEEFAILSKAAKQFRKDTRRFRGRDVYNSFAQPILQALELNMGPIVIYAGRRADVEGIALNFSKQLRQSYEGPEAEKLRERLKTLSGFEYVPPELQRLITRYGIAYHHSGMIPPGRVAIESLLKEGLLRICCGTMGISLGVNFAVRSAFISDESRPSESGETRYSNTEIMQMLGRAGRRGHDKQGFSLWFHAGRYAEQRPRERELCRSSLKFDPTTVIGILGQHQSIAYLSNFYQKSFFMIGKDSSQVLVADHDLLSGALYRKSGFENIACTDIPQTYKKFQKGKNRSDIACNRCPAKKVCHTMMGTARNSMLNKIVTHLQDVGALNDSVPTEMGNLARHFPQAGGLIIANWLAQGYLNKDTFLDYIQAMAAFGAAHFKEIPDTFADMAFLNDLKIPSLIEKYYPCALFPELYDEVKARRGEEIQEGNELVFREFNLGAASLIKHWLNPKTQWEDLVEEHSSKYFSAGDCMNVLFRFSTFLQSCGRLGEFDPALAAEAKRLQRVLLREPLDARNRMLVEEANELENIPESLQTGIIE
ncbi:DEAD/DEAH box helicase [Fluviispira multicolorata]|uniref:DEAD/DEAH box helicase n=1 Tax=Fluviispira multicolorata TaxID=2654512 RepID=A0A833N2J1_9BACT|nr:DEAD/DEAH box helicase [Fluviispira multicolorata]KAB8032257.1 DEAD/DEAH box helicase [Fluviispira multicolorata]